MELSKKAEKINHLALIKMSVEKDICNAQVYYRLLFDWLNGIGKSKKLYKNFHGIIDNLGNALVKVYIVSLAKLFTRNANEFGLLALINEVKSIPVEFFEHQLEREPQFVRNGLRHEREIFLENCGIYINQIREVEKRLNPLRNIETVHNFPVRKMKYKTLWIESCKWLNLAEKIYVNAMKASCESTAEVGEFVPKELDSQIRHFVSFLTDLNIQNGE